MSTSTLSFSNSAWKLNIILPLQVAVNVAMISTLRKSAFSNTLLSLAPVDIEKVPYFCLLSLIQIWALTKNVLVLGLANSCKRGYENKTPRRMNTVEYMGDYFYKLECAHENTLEAIVVSTVATVTAANLNLDPTLFAKLCMFNLLARIAYPFFYVFGPDMIRSIVFTFGLFSSVWVIIYSLFPELI